MGRRYDPCSFVGPRGARPAERRMVMAGPSPIVDEIQRAPDATHLGSSATWVIERRRDPRVPVSWGVRWIIGEWIVIFDTRALDASTHGLRVEMPMKELGGLGELLVLGQRHRIEILLSGGRRLTRIAEVRHVADGSIGFLIEEALPVEELVRTCATDLARLIRATETRMRPAPRADSSPS